MTDVVVSECMSGDALQKLGEEFRVLVDDELYRDPQRLQDAVAGARALIVRNQTQVTAELIRSATKLEVVARAGAGLDNIDTDAASAAGVVVTFAPHENSLSVAELALGLMLSLARNIPAAHHDTCNGGWRRVHFTGYELFGKTLGVVGLGRIGAMTAERAKALGMRIIAHDDYIDPRAEYVKALEAELMPLDELLAQADVVTLHVPLTDSTRGLIDYARLCRMKPTAVLINTSRGEVLDEAGLVQALSEQRLGGAALDVRQSEPPGDSPLHQMENVIVTPHIAAFTREAQDRVVAAVCRDVAAVLRGDEAANYFNFPTPARK